MERTRRAGTIAAVFTILIWGTTFISTKILLQDFQPVEILFFRFFLGILALYLVYPHRLVLKEKKQELVFAGAGICGVTLYYLLENIALTYTTASNISVILSSAPLFTGIVIAVFCKEEKLHWNFWLGFVVAMAGIAVISFQGGQEVQMNPLGDLLAILAAVVWAFYSYFVKIIGTYGYDTIPSTRRIFVYGLIFMLPALYFSDFHLQLERFRNPVYLFQIAFLGLGASAACFVTWNFAVKALGAVKTSIYIYLVPVITILAAVPILHEPFTFMTGLGTLLTLFGLVLSERKIKKEGEKVGK